MTLPPETLAELRRAGLVREKEPGVQVLTGGVSSDVWLVEDSGRKFVVKRSVPKLRVKAEWYADPARLRYEFLYLRTVADIVPGSVPRLLTSDPDSPVLAMEFLGDGFSNWKALMLGGEISPEHAAHAGEILGRIHAATTGNAAVRGIFDSMEFFLQLRIEAYLRATAEKQEPGLANLLLAEADRLAKHHECLVHGDYSPKNMLVSPDRFVVLDCETACYGDPAFDLAFVLNHLLLKALFHSGHRPDAIPRLRGAAEALRAAYSQAHARAAPAIEARVAHLLPMLLLARVDGKSPVEYLNSARQEHIRRFAPLWILRENSSLETSLHSYFAELPWNCP